MLSSARFRDSKLAELDIPLRLHGSSDGFGRQQQHNPATARLVEAPVMQCAS
jgi:hypothetical protein